MGVKLNFDGFFFSKKIIFFPKNGENRVKKGKNREKSQKFPKKSQKIPKIPKNYLEVDLTIWDFLGHPGSLLHFFGVCAVLFLGGWLFLCMYHCWLVLVHVKPCHQVILLNFTTTPTPTPPTSYHKLCKSA